MSLDAKIPSGPIEKKWEKHKFDMKLVNPANKRKYKVIVVGTGLAGGAAAATLGELGYNVEVFCFQDSPRRAHSIAAQGGINAAKNYQNDGDSVYRLFYDTVKGGDFRAREANVYRLAEVSVNIIDQCVAQGVPFAREYGGLLANRSFGGAQVSRTFYARGQTGQQLLLGAYQALKRQVDAGTRQDVPAHGDARPRRRSTAAPAASSRATWSPATIESHVGRRRGARAPAATATSSTSRPTPRARNATATWRAHKRGALLRQPLLHADPPDLHPGERRVPVEAHADVRSRCATTAASGCRRSTDDTAARRPDPRGRARLLPRAHVPELRQPRARATSPRAPPRACATRAAAWARGGLGVYLDFADAIKRLGQKAIDERYGNLFEMYERITDEDPYKVPMRIYPAVHYTMGGLWVDYNLHEQRARACSCSARPTSPTTAPTASAPAR